MKNNKFCNSIDHKCPCCGYEVEYGWDGKTLNTTFTKGDESFLKIESGHRGDAFETDKTRDVDYGPTAYEKVILLGCPKCGCVSYKIW